MQAHKKTLKQLAVIRETDCIGCTKCIQACPVDAIFGANKQMHTVIINECIGCKLCVPVCPVDCIDLIVHPNQNHHPEPTKQRFKNRKERLNREKDFEFIPLNQQSLADKKAFIEAAKRRKMQNK